MPRSVNVTEWQFECIHEDARTLAIREKPCIRIVLTGQSNRERPGEQMMLFIMPETMVVTVIRR